MVNLCPVRHLPGRVNYLGRLKVGNNLAGTIAFLWITGPALALATAGPGEPRPVADQPAVELKQLAPATVVFVEHRGPYWRIGGLFGQVAEFMAAHDQPGPMFARYLDDPGAVGATGLRAEVGFFVAGELVVSEPYRRAVWPARRVASLTVRGHYGRAPAAYERVFEWIKANGHRAEGPVTEVYLLAGGTAPGDRVTEIRVPLAGGVGTEAVELPAGGPSSADQPDAEPAVPAPDAYMQQVAVRVAAIRQAVAVSYPERASVVNAYLGPVLARAGWQQGQVVAEPAALIASAQAVPDRGSQPAALLSRLDALLVNVTLRRLEPAELLGQLAELTGMVSEAAATAHQQRTED